MEPRYRATLVVLSSTVTGDSLAERLGMRGDRHWDQGSPKTPTARSTWEHSGWAINSRLGREIRPRDHLVDLLDRSRSVVTAIRDLLERGDAESATFWLHLDSPQDAFVIEPNELREIAEIGPLAVDIYS